MNTDVAYILGLIIGGGVFGNNEDVLRIHLPYKRWGSYRENPERAGNISRDVMRMVSPLLRNQFEINVSYETSEGGEWNILCEGDLTNLKEQLESFGLTCEGEIKKTASLTEISPLLVDVNLKRRFIAGLADTIGSMNPNHRKFNDDIQIISFELSGFNYQFVIDLCQILHSIDCYPDQILWNHPNFHSGNDAYYSSWKKGTKIRVMLDQYDRYGSFAFTSKAQAAHENQTLQSQRNVAVPCSEKEIGAVSANCKHCQEDYTAIPENVRGAHFIHNKHVCAVLGCPYAPYEQISQILSHAEDYISPFTILTKGTNTDITTILNSNPIYERDYSELNISIQSLFNRYKNGEKILFGDGTTCGYPISNIVASVAFLIAAETNQLNGKRPKGNQDILIERYLESNPNATVIVQKPEILTPLILKKGNYSCLVGPINPNVYRNLIQRDRDNPYKISIRDITEDDLR